MLLPWIVHIEDDKKGHRKLMLNIVYFYEDSNQINIISIQIVKCLLKLLASPSSQSYAVPFFIRHIINMNVNFKSYSTLSCWIARNDMALELHWKRLIQRVSYFLVMWSSLASTSHRPLLIKTTLTLFAGSETRYHYLQLVT